MSNLITCRIKPYIQPFERKLALSELGSLTGTVPKQLAEAGSESLDYAIMSPLPAGKLAERLAIGRASAKGTAFSRPRHYAKRR
jgi:hypothetical protein